MVTTRSSIARLADDAPVPHPDSWPSREPPSVDRAAADIIRTARIAALNDPYAVVRAKREISAMTDERRFSEQLVALVEDAVRDAIKPVLVSLGAAEERISRLRASHDALLAAAQRVLATYDDNAHSTALKELQAAIDADEEQAQ